MQVNPSSLWKILDMVGRLSKEPLKVNFQGQVRLYTPMPLLVPDDFSSSNIDCQQCGECCAGIRHDLFWLKEPLLLKVVPIDLGVNGKVHTVYVYRNGGKPCHYLADRLCMIHSRLGSSKPVHCLMPPIKIDEWEGKCYLKKRFYTDFPCKAKVIYRSSHAEDLNLFKRLREEANAIGITLKEVKI